MNTKITKHTGLLTTAITAVTLLAAASATAATKWDMPTPYGDGYHQTINVRAFAADVKAATNGELDIVVHSGASLFKHPEIHRAVRTGQVPIGEMFMGILGNDDPVFKLDNIPFLASNFDQAKDLWDASRSAVEASFSCRCFDAIRTSPRCSNSALSELMFLGLTSVVARETFLRS